MKLFLVYFFSGQKRASSVSSVVHKFSQGRRTGVERGNTHQGLPAGGLRHQVHGGHMVNREIILIEFHVGPL